MSCSWLTARPIAHRGLHDVSRQIVENSLGAAKAARAKGYAIECDLRLSRDGRVFVFHDDDCLRLCGVAARFDALSGDDAASLRLKGSGEPVPTLEDWLAAAGDAPQVLELKGTFDGDASLARAVASVLAGHAGPVAIKSFDPAPIAWLRAQKATWPLGVVAQDDYEGDADFAALSREQRLALSRFTHAEATRPDFLSWRVGDLPNPVCAIFRALGHPVMTWTVKSPTQAAAAGKWADQIVFEGFLA